MKKLWLIAVFLSQIGLGFVFAEPLKNPAKNPPEKRRDFFEFVSHYVPLNPKTGKISIPEHIKHVKLDIGFSYYALMPQYWDSHEEDLIVFGFEPHPTSVERLLKGAIKRYPSQVEPLDPKYINDRFFLIPCALGCSEKESAQFYVTPEPCCCSIYEPSWFEVTDILEVYLFSLADFFEVFPFDQCPIIDHIKIDAQGADLDIVKGAGTYLMDHVVYITLKPENHQYKHTSNSQEQIEYYMMMMGFLRCPWVDTRDPTYINSRFMFDQRTYSIKVYQNG